MTFEIHHGMCLDVLKTFPDNSFDSIVTDPPYGISFMGKKWDYDVPSVEEWAECLRVLKPGGHLLAFAGTRTQHRMAVRIEDAGFEIRDMIAWVYGSGFPKSLNVSKAIDKDAGAERETVKAGTRSDASITAPATEDAKKWDGWGTALKPAMEPITVARKPLTGTVAANVLEWGTGAINIDGCRVEPTGESRERVSEASQDRRYTEAGGTNFAALPGPRGGAPEGRWPANLIHDGSGEVVERFPESNGSGSARVLNRGTRRDEEGWGMGDHPGELRDGGTGSAARFFHCAHMEDQEWLEALSPALIAEDNLCLQNLAECIAQSDVVTSVLPVGNQLSVSIAPSTSVTPKQSRQIASSAIETIKRIASGYLLARRPEKHTRMHEVVSAVVSQTPTGIMTITINHSEFVGSAGSITFNITQKNSEVGGKDCVLLRGDRFIYCAKASKSDRGEGNDHPTVKPTELMRYLCRLVTPPGGKTLDPWVGSGSTGKAAILEGFDFTGIERDIGSVETARRRIGEVASKASLTNLFE